MKHTIVVESQTRKQFFAMSRHSNSHTHVDDVDELRYVEPAEDQDSKRKL